MKELYTFINRSCWLSKFPDTTYSLSYPRAMEVGDKGQLEGTMPQPSFGTYIQIYIITPPLAFISFFEEMIITGPFDSEIGFKP